MDLAEVLLLRILNIVQWQIPVLGSVLACFVNNRVHDAHIDVHVVELVFHQVLFDFVYRHALTVLDREVVNSDFIVFAQSGFELDVLDHLHEYLVHSLVVPIKQFRCFREESALLNLGKLVIRVK